MKRVRRFLTLIGAALLFLAIALCLAPTLVPPFLDRIYYRGPASDHFDGRRFFNPGEPEPGAAQRRARARFLARALSSDRAKWPPRVAVPQGIPPARVAGEDMRATWIGHATVLVQTAGLNILTDPIWSRRASPFSFVGPRRVRRPGVAFDHLPKIDLVLLSHNHYDHMDLPTLERLWRRDRPLIVTSLGNGAILRRHGIDAAVRDWGESVPLPGKGEVLVLRNHHWSSRWGSDRNRALWSAFAVRLPGGAVFFAGDTGWGDGSWVREAAARGPYRLAIIPIGAYQPRDFMKQNHVDPDEAMRIHAALDPGRSLGVHWGTFQLTFEPIDEPRQRIEALRLAAGGKAAAFLVTGPGETFRVPPRAARAEPAVR